MMNRKLTPRALFALLLPVTVGSISIPAYGQFQDVWARHYDGPASAHDGASAITVDRKGNVYVTGRSVGVNTNYDYATVKYSSNGSLLWSRRYEGFGNDEAAAIVVDANGNVFVTGKSWGGGGNQEDYLTLKYSANGDELWERRHNRSGGGYDAASAIAVDASGAVYVAGSSGVIKYSPSGDSLWFFGFSATALELDKAGNIVVAGSAFTQETRVDYAVAKVTADGTLLWSRSYNSPSNSYDFASGLAVDADGNCYITGQCWSTLTGGDYGTVKYDRDGNWMWFRRYNGPGSSEAGGSAVGVDRWGNVYVTGWAQAGDYATFKYDSAGNELWRRGARGVALITDEAGNVCITGSGYGTVMYDASGVEKWRPKWDIPLYDNASASAMTLDRKGNLYLTGYSGYNYNTPLGDYLTLKYSPW